MFLPLEIGDLGSVLARVELTQPFGDLAPPRPAPLVGHDVSLSREDISPMRGMLARLLVVRSVRGFAERHAQLLAEVLRAGAHIGDDPWMRAGPHSTVTLVPTDDSGPSASERRMSRTWSSLPGSMGAP